MLPAWGVDVAEAETVRVHRPPFHFVKVLPEVEWRAGDPDGLSFSKINTPENLEQLRWI